MIQLVWLTICFQIFIYVYTIIQVVHTEFIKVVLTKYSAFKSPSKMIQEEAAVAIIIAVISEKKSQEKIDKKKQESSWNLGLKEEKT